MASIPQRKKRKDSLIPKVLIVILGPTAAGKSNLGVALASAFKGEIISADSRQVYKDLDIGTGKIRKQEMRGITHHLLDISSPRKPYTVSTWKREALGAIDRIRKKGKIPFLVGGSPLYLYALVDQWSIPEVKPDAKLRKRLARLSPSVLLAKLRELDPERADSIEPKNKRRIIRAIEIVTKTKRPVPSLNKTPLPYPVLFIGITRSQKILSARIAKRLDAMIKHGLLKEVQKLKAQGLSWKRINELGFEYRYAAAYLRKKCLTGAKFGKAVGLADGAKADTSSREEMRRNIQKATEDFVRRQMSWFKKDPRIHWLKNLKEAKSLTKTFLLNLV